MSTYEMSNEEIKKAYLHVTKQLKDAYAVAIGILDADYKKKVLYYLAVRHFVQKIERGNMPPHITPETINKHVEELIAELEYL